MSTGLPYLHDEANYYEANARKDFVEPFFRALNWDIDNQKGFSEACREVMLEKTLLCRQIEAPDVSIDTLIYDLYALKDEEIKIVEEKV
jgi:hypothetical protein